MNRPYRIPNREKIEFEFEGMKVREHGRVYSAWFTWEIVETNTTFTPNDKTHKIIDSKFWKIVNERNKAYMKVQRVLLQEFRKTVRALVPKEYAIKIAPFLPNKHRLMQGNSDLRKVKIWKSIKNKHVSYGAFADIIYDHFSLTSNGLARLPIIVTYKGGSYGYKRKRFKSLDNAVSFAVKSIDDIITTQKNYVAKHKSLKMEQKKLERAVTRMGYEFEIRGLGYVVVKKVLANGIVFSATARYIDDEIVFINTEIRQPNGKRITAKNYDKMLKVIGKPKQKLRNKCVSCGIFLKTHEQSCPHCEG